MKSDINIDTLIKWFTKRANKEESSEVLQWLDKDSERKRDFVLMQKLAQDSTTQRSEERALKSWENFRIKINITIFGDIHIFSIKS